MIRLNSKIKLTIAAIGIAAIVAIATSVFWLTIIAGVSFSDLPALGNLVYSRMLIKRYYVSESNDKVLLEGALRGMVNELADPHSYYLDPAMLSDFKRETIGSYSGIGLVLAQKDKKIIVIAPIDGSPAANNGLQSGDWILKIDEQATDNMPVDEAALKIRGQEGTTVNLTVLRSGQDAFDVSITRANIKLNSVSGKIIGANNDIGYIRITSFNEHSGQDFAQKLMDLQNQGMKKLVLDLRDNPGGLIDECVKISRLLIPQGLLVTVDGRHGLHDEYNSDLPVEKAMPLVILVNGGSASASEIVAGAVQDRKIGKLVGEKTFGKGSVQSLYNLTGGAAIKITIAKYYTPDGRSIDGVGLQPDILVKSVDGSKRGTDSDNQLQVAINQLAN